MTRNPRRSTEFVIAAVHFGFAVVLFWRPNIQEFSRAYIAFGNTEAWGVGLLAVSIGLAFSPLGSLLLMFWNLMSAMALFAISLLVSLGYGPNTGTSTYAVLGWVSLLLFARTFSHWLRERRWFQRLAASPPRWWPPGGDAGG